MKPRVIGITPALENDAIWSPIRTSPNLGMWYLLSKLREQGYAVRWLDETTRQGGRHNHQIVERVVECAIKTRHEKSGKVDHLVDERPVKENLATLIRSKQRDFARLTPKEFVARHSAFRVPGQITRTVVRTGTPVEETLKALEYELARAKGGPVVVGITLPAMVNYVSAIRTGKAIKDTFGSHVKVIYGGQTVTALAHQILRENPWIDLLVCGDGVGIIEDAVQKALDGSTKILINRGGQEDISTYPLLDPSLLEENKYPVRPNHTYDTAGRKWVDFMLSRGCGRSCEFCGAGSIAKKKKKFSVIPLERLKLQLELFKRAGIEELVIQDDALLSNKRLPEAIALFKEYGFWWQNNGGIEYEKLNATVVNQWCDYNGTGEGRVRALYIPFNPREWNKGQSAAVTQTGRHPDQIEFLRRLREAGVYVFSSEIIAQPREPREVAGADTARYVGLIKEGYLDQALTFAATILPGTRWWWEHHALIASKIDYIGFALSAVNSRTYEIDDPREIERWVIERNQALNAWQRSYAWGSAFPNVGPQVGE